MPRDKFACAVISMPRKGLPVAIIWERFVLASESELVGAWLAALVRHVNQQQIPRSAVRLFVTKRVSAAERGMTVFLWQRGQLCQLAALAVV